MSAGHPKLPAGWRPTANVFTIDVEAAAETGGDKFFESLKKDAAKGRKRAEIEKCTIGKANIERRQNAQDEHQKIRKIVLKLYESKPELRRASREKLALEVQAVLKRYGIKKSTKAIKRALPNNARHSRIKRTNDGRTARAL